MFCFIVLQLRTLPGVILSVLKDEILCTLHPIQHKHYGFPTSTGRYWVLSHVVLESLGKQPVLSCVSQCLEHEIVSLTTDKQ